MLEFHKQNLTSNALIMARMVAILMRLQNHRYLPARLQHQLNNRKPP